MVEPTWARREQPILEAIDAEEHEKVVVMESVQRRTDLLADDISRGLRALHENGLVTGQKMHGYRGFPRFALVNMRLSGDARRAIGQWPGDAYSSLVAILEARIEASPDPN